MRYLYNVVDLVGVVVLVRNFGVSLSFVFGGLCEWVSVSSVLQPVTDSGLTFLLGALEVIARR